MYGRYLHIDQLLKCRTSLYFWLLGMPCSHFITFNFNCNKRLDLANKSIKNWHAGVDRALVGKFFNQLPREQRTFFIGCFEHIDTNLHAHALVNCPYEGFEQAAIKTWAKLVPSGSLFISGGAYDQRMQGLNPDLERLYRSLNTPSGKEIAVRYLLKEQHKIENYESLILSNVFLPK